MCDLILEYLFCCQYTNDNKIIDLLEDLATKKKKCSLNVKIYNNDYYTLYMDVLKHFKRNKKTIQKSSSGSLEEADSWVELGKERKSASRRKIAEESQVRPSDDNTRVLDNRKAKMRKVRDLSEGSEEGQTLVIKNWSSIRKKVVKDLVLKNFIIEVKNKYHFTEETTNNLKRDLTIGLNFKNINDKNIIITDNKITSITGLQLSHNKYEWQFDIKVFTN